MKLKEIIWISSSKKDLLSLPEDVVNLMGYGLFLAQKGQQHGAAKVLKGFGSAGVVEIIDSDSSGTYRVVYTVQMAEAVFVLHSLQKKSKQGIKTPQKDIDLIHSRLKLAIEMYKVRFKKK